MCKKHENTRKEIAVQWRLSLKMFNTTILYCNITISSPACSTVADGSGERCIFNNPSCSRNLHLQQNRAQDQFYCSRPFDSHRLEKYNLLLCAAVLKKVQECHEATQHPEGAKWMHWLCSDPHTPGRTAFSRDHAPAEAAQLSTASSLNPQKRVYELKVNTLARPETLARIGLHSLKFVLLHFSLKK